MSKFISILTSTILAFFFYPADKAKNDLMTMNLKGEIESITELSYGINKFENGVLILAAFDSAKVEKVFFAKKITKFNTVGNLTEERYYNDKIIYARDIYQYDTINNKMEKLSYGTANIWDDKLLRKFDANNDIVEENYYGRDKSIKNAPAVHTAQVFYTYDKERNRVARDWITIMDTSHSHQLTSYKYDEHNNMIESKSMFPESGIEIRTEFKYDERNNKIEEIYLSSDGKIYTTSYKYDELGNELEKDEINSDTRGQQKSTHKYSYDKMGNWIIDTFKRYDNFNCIYERKIDYY